MWQISPLRALQYPEAETFNRQAAAAIATLRPEDFRERSHFFGGRYENLYLNGGRLPGLEALVDFVVAQSALRLSREAAELRCGFWLNRMAPGDSTSRHAHAENDELLSAVYYIQVPEASGDLLFDDDPFEIRVRPEAGLCVLFDPELPHWVERHAGRGERLSLAFNIGPAVSPAETG